VRAFWLPSFAALLCLALAAWSPVVRAQVLSSGDGSSVVGQEGGQEGGGLLAGKVRTLRPALATQLTSPAVMEADGEGSALPLQVAFEAGSARLTVSATRSLDHLGEALSTGPLAGERLRIEGHADPAGSRDANKDISERRAMAVAAYLEQNFAISPARLVCTGVGAAPPGERVVVILRLTSG
jgi:outer membrane protein OmpA-like peptidoglycan-associated protein